MNHIKTYTGIRLDPKTFENLEKTLQYLEEITEELDIIKEENNDLFGLWDASNTAYGSLWDFLTGYKNYRKEVSGS